MGIGGVTSSRMKGTLFLLLISQLAHPLDVGSSGGTRGAVEAQEGGGTVLHHAIFANVVSFQPAFCVLSLLTLCIVRRSVRLVFFFLRLFSRNIFQTAELPPPQRPLPLPRPHRRHGRRSPLPCPLWKGQSTLR